METTFVWHCGESDMVDIASGYVPNAIKGLARQMLNGHDEELRMIEARERARSRKVRKPKQRRKLTV